VKVDVLCSDPLHPVFSYLQSWQDKQTGDIKVRLLTDTSELSSGAILFLVSCNQILTAIDRAGYDHVMVLHASDLPVGRGWSPHIWDILAGKETLTLSLIAAEDGVDTGDIWAKCLFQVPAHMLYDEINHALFSAEISLMEAGIRMVREGARATPQQERDASYHPPRRPQDSKVDPKLPLEDLFHQLRVADPDRFPAFFDLHGTTYEISLKKRKR